MTLAKSPYGGGPGAGLTIPPYFTPTPSVRSRNNYFPNSEKLGPDEMRISFMGSTPFPPPGAIRLEPALWSSWATGTASFSTLDLAACATSFLWVTRSSSCRTSSSATCTWITTMTSRICCPSPPSPDAIHRCACTVHQVAPLNWVPRA